MDRYAPGDAMRRIISAITLAYDPPQIDTYDAKSR